MSTPSATINAEELQRPLRACASGQLPPNMALTHMIALADTREALEVALAAGQRREITPEAAERIAAAVALWRATPGAWNVVKSVLTVADHGAMAASTQEWAARFDRAARISPEASAAVYSLGRAGLAEASASSIVRGLQAWGLTGQHRAALDLGCGCGRLLAALSQHMRRIVGIDVSAGMLTAARLRCRGITNVALVQTSGQDLSAFSDRVFDLVVAVDVFPYLVSCKGDLAQRHIGEAFRVLAPGGSLVILNYAYGKDAEADAAQAIAHADRAGFRLVRTGCNDFELWDGRTFHFRRSEA
jgi:SAM-dependent methyltransferase